MTQPGFWIVVVVVTVGVAVLLCIILGSENLIRYILVRKE